MLTVARQRTPRFHQARDIAALIDLYESNFLRLMHLAPDLEALQGTAVSRVAGAMNLYLTVLERHPYTTSVNLTYRFNDGTHYSLEPYARVCVYHDVRAAELISHYRRRRSGKTKRWRPWQRQRMPEVDRKWEMNRFLLKWLRFCTHQGHIFLSCTAERDCAFEKLIKNGSRVGSTGAFPAPHTPSTGMK